MATVDERVVKMKLDGSEFQSGASKVSSCLDSLKEKLKFKDAGKGLDDISKKTKSLSFDDVALSVSALEKRFSTMGIVGINVINRITDSVINLSRRLTSFVTSGIIQGGITRAMNLENAHFQLQGLLKDEQEVQAVMKNVSDSVDGTAYSLDAAAKVASQLAASGMRAGDQMYSSLRAVAGVAAMTNSSYEDIGMIFTQVAGQGRVMGQDLLQLSSRGMNAAATLGQAMGKSEAEIRDMVSKGKISFQDFASAMDNAFGEHAKKANESFNGAMSNVKASLARIGAEFVSPLIVQNGPFVQFFNTLRERINDIKSEIGPLADMFVKTTTGVVNSMTQMFKKLDVKDYVKSFVNVTEGFGNVANGLLHILKMVRDGFNEVFSTISGKELYDLTKQFRDFTENLKPSAKVLEQIKQVAKGVFSLFDIGVQVVKALGTAISTAFGGSGLGNILEGLLNVAAGFSSWIIGLDESIKKLGLFQGVAKTVGTALRSMLDFLGLVANGFSSIGTAASAVSSKMVSVATTIRNTIGNAFEKTYQVMNKVFSVIKDNITMDDILAGITGGGIVLVVKKITATFDKVAGLVERINDVFGEIFDKNGEKIKNGAEVLKQLLNNLGEALKAFTNNVKSFALLEISAAIAILVNSLRKIAELNAMEVTGGIVAIGAMMGELNMSMKSISKTLDKYDPQKLIQMGIALVGFAKAIEILAKAMSIVGRMDLNQIANGLVGIGGAMAELTIAAKGLNNSNISVKTVLSLVVLTKAVSMLAEPLRKLGQMSWGEVGRGLSAMGGAMAELTAVAKGLSYSKVSIKTSASLIVMAQSVKMIADPLKQLGRMSWDEIKQGLSAMGGAIAEMGAAVGLLGRFGRNNLSASVSILIVTKSLTDIAHALGEFAYYNWDEIKRGLTAMGGALAEIGIVTGALGKIAGISSLIASGSIFIVAKGLGDIAQAFAVFASFNWSEIGRGLVAMGGALAEIGLITGALGKLGGISSLFASGAIFIVAKGLGDIANAFGDFASFDWGEIGRGLVAMGGALAEIGLVTGALGKLAGISGLIGAGTLLLAVQGLDDLAKAFDSFAQYSWDEIGRGLVAMGGAMLEVGVIAGATGALTGIAGLVGAGTITLASKGLDDLAAAFAKFAAFDWEEIKRGLTAMAGALGATALGSLLNTFSGFGAGAIEKVAGPLGILADSVKRWENVKVPDGLHGQLGKLADGIMKFTFAGWGGDVVATVAKPMDVLANAITKWSKITFPTDIGSQLKELSSGVTSFTLAFAGGWSLNAVVGPFGQLADSVKKWSNVIIPNGIGHDLSSLADGVKSFTWAFAGGMSLGAINGPLGDLAGSVKKWNGVTIPKGIKSGLSELADGVKSFSFAFLGGMSLGSINGPLGELAGSVKKWNGVVVPANIGSSLKSLADGVNAFTSVNADIGTTVASVSTLFKALGTLATNAQKLSGVNLPGLAATISSFVASLNSTATVTSNLPSQLSAFSSKLAESSKAITSSLSSASSQVKTQLQNMVSSVSSGTSSMSGALNQLKATFDTFKSNLSASLKAVNDVLKTGLNQGVTSVKGYGSKFNSAGKDLGKQLTNGVKSGVGDVRGAFTSKLDSAVNAARAYRSNFHSAGAYVAKGFADGIRSNINSAASAAAQMAQAASNAARKNLDIHSPSRVFRKIGDYVGQGFVLGLNQTEKRVGEAAASVGNSAISGFQTTLGEMKKVLSTDVSIEPSITPVVDMSGLTRQSTNISSLLSKSNIGMGKTVDGLTSLGNVVSTNEVLSQYQNEMMNSNRDLQKSLGDLRDDLGKYNDQLMNSETSIFVDGRKLASSIAKPMNQELGVRSRRGNLAR